MKQTKGLALWAAALCLVLALAACSRQDRWQQQFDLGMRYLTESSYQEAIAAFTDAIKVNPRQVDAYVYLAQVYLASGDPETAQQILTQGYDATDDPRLDCSGVDAWFLYNSNLAFDQQLAYRDFDSLSADQQQTVRQAVAAAKAGQGEEIQALLAGSSLPPQLFTRLDGEQVEITVLPQTDDPLFLKGYEAMSGQYLEGLERQDPAGIERVGQFLVLTVRPENGTEYCWCSQDITYSNPGDEQDGVLTVQAEAYQTSECENGQYDGSWKNQGTMWADGNRGRYMTVEASGTAAGGEKFKDGPTVLRQVEEGVETVYEYQGDQLIAWYMNDPSTGERVDMMEMMQGLLGQLDQLTE